MPANWSWLPVVYTHHIEYNLFQLSYHKGSTTGTNFPLFLRWMRVLTDATLSGDHTSSLAEPPVSIGKHITT